MVCCSVQTIGYAAIALIVAKIGFSLYRTVYAFFFAEKIRDLIEYSGGKWAGRLTDK